MATTILPPLRSFEIPGGPIEAPETPEVKTSDFPRGGDEDRKKMRAGRTK